MEETKREAAGGDGREFAANLTTVRLKNWVLEVVDGVKRCEGGKSGAGRDSGMLPWFFPNALLFRRTLIREG